MKRYRFALVKPLPVVNCTARATACPGTHLVERDMATDECALVNDDPTAPIFKAPWTRWVMNSGGHFEQVETAA